MSTIYQIPNDWVDDRIPATSDVGSIQVHPTSFRIHDVDPYEIQSRLAVTFHDGPRMVHGIRMSGGSVDAQEGMV